MQNLFSFMKGLFRGSASVEAGELGSDGDPIRQMLFGSQTLKEQVQRIRLNGSPGPLPRIVDASKLVDSGKRKEAIECLRGIFDSPSAETRTQLWVWSALRGLGEKPEPKYAFEVLGAIIETPMGGAYDTLAAYVDGTARYLNYSGKAIFWDAPDPIVKQECQALVSSTIPASGGAKPRTSLSLPRELDRFHREGSVRCRSQHLCHPSLSTSERTGLGVVMMRGYSRFEVTIATDGARDLAVASLTWQRMRAGRLCQITHGAVH
jgi:hypothetical protein